MPAIVSAIFSAIYAALAKKENYAGSLTTTFPAMDVATAHNGTSVFGVTKFSSIYSMNLISNNF